MIRVLLVNHSLSHKCGIYAHGVRMYNILAKSKNYSFHYCKANSLEDLSEVISLIKPSITIYNYTPALMGWANAAKEIYQNIQHVALIHDITPDQMLDSNIGPFDFRIALDPTLAEVGRWFTSVRPLFNYTGSLEHKNQVPTIGSFGFYFSHLLFSFQ